MTIDRTTAICASILGAVFGAMGAMIASDWQRPHERPAEVIEEQSYLCRSMRLAQEAEVDGLKFAIRAKASPRIKNERAQTLGIVVVGADMTCSTQHIASAEACDVAMRWSTTLDDFQESILTLREAYPVPKHVLDTYGASDEAARAAVTKLCDY